MEQQYKLQDMPRYDARTIQAYNTTKYGACPLCGEHYSARERI